MPNALRLFAFIDTNVLLHYRFFRDVNWAKELRADRVALVLAPVVVEELDKRKWAGARRDRERAKKVLRALRDLGLSARPVRMRAGVEIMALDAEPADALFTRYRLQPRVSDDRLLASVLALKEAESGHMAILTADTGLNIKAATRQITVVAPDERLREDDEPDETERELEAARRELAAIRAVAPILRLTLAGKTVLEHQVRRFSEFGAGKLGRLLEAWRSRHPHVRATPSSIAVPGGVRFSLEGLTGLPGFWSKEEATKHNTQIDRVYGEYDAFLRRWPAELNALARCVGFHFVLENAGTAPADDVDLLISAAANGRWLEELPELPTAPTMPRPRSPFDFGIMRPLERFDPSSLHLVNDPIDGPNIPEDEPHTVRYTVKRVKHHMPCKLPVVYFQFDSDDDVQSFTLRYCLIAANIREPKSDDLHVKLSVSTAMEPPSPEDLLSRRGEDDEHPAGDDEREA